MTETRFELAHILRIVDIVVVPVTLTYAFRVS